MAKCEGACSGVRIRDVTRHHIPLLQAIETSSDQLFLDMFHPENWPQAASGEERDRENGFIRVAEVDGAACGFAHVLDVRASVPSTAHLEQLSVAAGYQRRGVGAALMQNVIAAAQRAGYSRITLRTYADVPWNAPFYAKWGFTEQQFFEPFYADLISTEQALGLERYGRRIAMGRDVP